MIKQNILFENGNIIDVVSGEVYEGSILVEDGIITKVYPNLEHSVILTSPYIRVIDLKGKWIIPGLIDMHVHIKEGFAPIFTASGVTTVRNTGGNVLELKKLREASIGSPTPKVISADRIIDGPPGLWGGTSPWSINIDNHVTARNEVNRQVKAGADFIKVYGWLNKEVMNTVVEEAKKYNKEVSCDLIYSSNVNAIDAALMGIRWNEHASGIIQAIYPKWFMQAEEEIWSEIDWNEPDVSAIKEVCLKLIECHVVLCPTMVIYDQANLVPHWWSPDNKITKKIEENTGLVQQWKTISQYKDGLRKLGVQHKINKLITKIYHELGGTVVAGTDVPAGVWTFPGMALHRELELFIEAGFSEIDAIRAATCRAAEALNNSQIGVIKEGAFADLVILNANPLENIKHTNEIEMVIKGGEVYSQDQLLEQVPSEEYARKAYEEFVKQFTDEIEINSI